MSGLQPFSNSRGEKLARMKRPSCKAGLKEGPKKKKEKTGEAEGEGKPEEQEKLTKEEGLQEGQPKKETEIPRHPPIQRKPLRVAFH